MIIETKDIPPLPVLVAKEIFAIGPLPEKGWVLMIAILIFPLSEVPAASIAPVTRLPWVTVGLDNESES